MRSRSLGEDLEFAGDAGALDRGYDFGLPEKPITSEFVAGDVSLCDMGPERSGSKWRYGSCFFSEAKTFFFQV